MKRHNVNEGSFCERAACLQERNLFIGKQAKDVRDRLRVHARVNQSFAVNMIFYSWVKDMGLQVTEVVVSTMFGQALIYVTTH